MPPTCFLPLSPYHSDPLSPVGTANFHLHRGDWSSRITPTLSGTSDVVLAAWTSPTLYALAKVDDVTWCSFEGRLTVSRSSTTLFARIRVAARGAVATATKKDTVARHPSVLSGMDWPRGRYRRTAGAREGEGKGGMRQQVPLGRKHRGGGGWLLTAPRSPREDMRRATKTRTGRRNVRQSRNQGRPAANNDTTRQTHNPNTIGW